LISKYGFGHGFATMRPADPTPQPQLRQTTLFDSNVGAPAAHFPQNSTEVSEDVEPPLIVPVAQVRATKDVVADMYLEEGGVGFQRPIAPSGGCPAL
jgi:hypothetical protein